MELQIIQYATIEEYNQIFDDEDITNTMLQNASEYINDLIFPNQIKVQSDVELYSQNVKLATIYQANYSLVNFGGNDPSMSQYVQSGFSLGDLTVNAPNKQTGSEYSQLINKTCQKSLYYLKKEGLLYSGITRN